MSMAGERDERIRQRLFSWKNVILIYLALLLLNWGQFLVMGSCFGGMQLFPPMLVLGLLGYWAAFAAVFCLLVHRYIQSTFVTPVLKLGDAARRVAEGDYSVYVAPLHVSNRANCLDVMTEDFNRMVAELGKGEVQRSDFVANVSHEIRTPVAVIESCAALLGQDSLEPGARGQCVAELQRASRSLVTLAGRLLTLTELESGDFPGEKQTCSLCAQLSDCVLRYEEALDHKRIEVTMDVDEDLTVEANPALLELVWDSLISNAVKFAPEEGRIILQAGRDGGGVSVSIRDNGCGMSDATMNRAFDLFYQGDESHAQEGSGLGLSVARAAARLCEGTISVQSREGVGTEFRVHLPGEA